MKYKEVKRHMLALSQKNKAILLATAIVCGLISVMLLVPLQDIVRVPIGIIVSIVIFFYGKNIQLEKNKERYRELVEILELGDFQSFRTTANPAKPNKVVRIISNVDTSKRVDIPAKRWKKIEKLPSVINKALA